jgi:hypothetical protein
MTTAAKRRAAYRFVVEAIERSLQDVPWVNEPSWPSISVEVVRIQNAMLAAGRIVDGPGVEEHVSGDGKPPVVFDHCPAYGTNGCRHAYPGNDKRDPDADYCIGSKCVAYARGERPAAERTAINMEPYTGGGGSLL